MVRPTRRLLSKKMQDFPGGIVGKNSPANAGDMSLTPGPGRIYTLQSN